MSECDGRVSGELEKVEVEESKTSTSVATRVAEEFLHRTFAHCSNAQQETPHHSLSIYTLLGSWHRSSIENQVQNVSSLRVWAPTVS